MRRRTGAQGPSAPSRPRSRSSPPSPPPNAAPLSAETVEMHAIYAHNPPDWFPSEAQQPSASVATPSQAVSPFVPVSVESEEDLELLDSQEQRPSPRSIPYPYPVAPSPKPPGRSLHAHDARRSSRRITKYRDHIDIYLGEVDGVPEGLDEEESTEDEGFLKGPSIGGKLKSALGFGRAEYESPTDDGGAAPDVEAQSPGHRREDKGKAQQRWSAPFGPTNKKNLPPYPPSTSSHVQQRMQARQSKYERHAAALLHNFSASSARASSSPTATRTHSSLRPAGLGTGTGTGEHARADPALPHGNKNYSLSLRPPPPPGGGVLSSLLMLYEQEREQGHFPAYSSATSFSHATPSEMTSAMSDWAPHEDFRRQTAGLPLSLPRSPPRAPASFSLGEEEEKRPFLRVLARGMNALGLGPDVLEMIERPQAARSGAGVFGALVASTGSLIGSVSPLHSTLGPAPNRPGFTLDRYVLPEINARTLQHTRQILAEASAPPPSTVGRDSSSTMAGYSLLKQPASISGRSAPWESMLGGIRSFASTPSQLTLANPEGSKRHYAADSIASASHALLPSRRSSLSLSDTYPGMEWGSARQSYLSLRPSEDAISATLPENPFASPKASSSAPLGPIHGSDDYFGVLPLPGSRAPTLAPSSAAFGSDFGGSKESLDQRRAWRKKVKKRRRRMRRERIYITVHLAAVLERQDFLLKLARCLLMFGAPPHKIDIQILKTAQVLDVNCQCVFLPQMLLVSFQDTCTHTSEQHIVKQAPALDLVKLTAMHDVYMSVISDRLGVMEASAQLDDLMRSPPRLGKVKLILIGGLCSASITPGPMGFNGSLIDAMLAAVLGSMVVAAQLLFKSDSVMGTELLVAGVNSFITSAVFQNGEGYFCSSAALGGSIVLILPSLTYLFASLEAQSRRSLVPGAIRMASGVLNSLFLGFGISLGSAVWTLVSDRPVNLPPAMSNCSAMQNHPGQWWRSGVGYWWAFLTVPLFTTGLALRNQAKLRTREYLVQLVISIAGWCVSHFTALRPLLSHRTDLLAMFGSLTVAFFGNVYGHFANGRSFTVSVPGMLYQLPNGMANGQGLLLFAQSNDSTTTESTFSNGFRVAENLITTAMGMAVGLFLASMLSNLLLGFASRSRPHSIFSF